MKGPHVFMFLGGARQRVSLKTRQGLVPHPMAWPRRLGERALQGQVERAPCSLLAARPASGGLGQPQSHFILSWQLVPW